MYRPRVVIPEIHQNVSNYTSAMYAAGIDPILVSVQSIHLAHSSQKEYMDWQDVRPEFFDGLLIPGGGDINPQEYGEENQGSIPVDPWIDRLQFELLDRFIRQQKPVLGICRGLQMINVSFGGSLIQDLEDALVHLCIPRCTDQIHACQAVKGSWIENLYGESFVHNSNHHQAIRTLGEDLVPDGVCPLDGVIESFHHAALPVFGVQWHPERMCLSHERADTVNGLAVFRFFCALCGGEPGLEDPYADDPFRRNGIVSEGMGL